MPHLQIFHSTIPTRTTKQDGRTDEMVVTLTLRTTDGRTERLNTHKDRQTKQTNGQTLDKWDKHSDTTVLHYSWFGALFRGGSGWWAVVLCTISRPPN